MSIKISSLNYTYPEQKEPAVDISSLTIDKSAVTAFIGGNGSGKSTLMKILGRLITPADFQIEGLPAKVIYVHQEPVLFAGSIARNIALPLYFAGRKKLSARCGRDFSRKEFKVYVSQRVSEVLSLTGLESLEKRRFSSMSGGEKKRCAIARALLTDADVFLFDEPDSGIDKKSRAIISEIFIKLKAQGKSVIFSSHSDSFTYKSADKVLLFEDGRILENKVNILEGSITGRENGLAVFSNGASSIFMADTTAEISRVTVRFDDIFLANEKVHSSARNVLKCNVSNIEKRGKLYCLTLDCGFLLKTEITAQAFSELNIQKEATIYAGFKATAVKGY